jgi:hypothetical protein
MTVSKHLFGLNPDTDNLSSAQGVSKRKVHSYDGDNKPIIT